MRFCNLGFKTKRFLNSLLVSAAVALAAAAPAQAAVDIANTPLSVTSSVDPNIMFVLDDSGSMHWEIMPDDYIYSYFTYPRPSGIYGSGDYTNYVVDFSATNTYSAVVRSQQTNSVYYNPAITYRPWKNWDGSDFPNASITCAPHNPVNTGLGCRDLTVDNTQWAYWETCSSQWSCTTTGTTRTFWPAVYYTYNGGGVWNNANYTRIEIRSSVPTYTGSANRSDCAAAPSCTYTEEIQNFANWYTYYRSRILAARGGVGRAFAEQGEGMRVGFGAINKGVSSVDGLSTRTIIRGVRGFSGTDRENFFTSLYEHPIPSSGTPLRRALEAAGQYYRWTDNRGPWGAVPGTNDGTAHLQCRQSYTILMTDGYWNGGDPTVSGITNTNVDNENGPIHTNPEGSNYQYTASDPYRDSHSETLADVAMYYWKNDLRTDLTNRVPVNSRDNAFWQHMVTFGVGLGVTGSVTPADAWSAVETGAAIAWPDPTATNPAKIDDLLHAGVNSHGGFFSAADPDTFATELSAVLDDIVSRAESSATAAATSSTVLNTDTLVYTAGFRSSDWSGQLIAETIDDPLTDARTTQWDAEVQLRLVTPSARKIFTRDDSTGSNVGGGVAFEWANLSAAQQAALNRDLSGSVDGLGVNRINWLRGDEAAHASFRSRSSTGDTRLLGDVVHSNPQLEFKQDYGYSLISGLASSYNTYRSTAPYTTRPNVLYVGGNDGMLHAFDGATGNELFAYIPSELLAPEGAPGFAPLNRLMDPGYQHRYYVDGTAALGDVQISSVWKTVLVGSMGAGGRTVFALDVTNPTGFNDSKVLWEFTDPDLGYGVGQPIVTRMRGGRWVAVFGNGYNSANHRAMIFVVDISDGSILAKIDTGVGDAANPNGIAEVNLTDWPVLDLDNRYIYAGDLQGNVWRIDVDTTNASLWANSSRRTRLFQAVDSSSSPQPITTRLRLALNPNDPNTLMVLFGTGSYFRTSDKDLSNPQIQSVYGVIDNIGNTTISRSDLVVQTVTWQGTHPTTGERVRELSDNPILGTHKGWVLDLAYQGNGDGERVVSGFDFPAGVIQDQVSFRTILPNDDPCQPGSRGYLYQFLTASGGRTQDSVFDLDNDGNIDVNDKVSNKIINARELDNDVGEGAITRIRMSDSNMDLNIGAGLSRNNAGPAGRQSWRQYR